MELQLDIIKLLADGGTPRLWEEPGKGLEEEEQATPPHPAVMALTHEYNFCAGAFLIGIYS